MSGKIKTPGIACMSTVYPIIIVRSKRWIISLCLLFSVALLQGCDSQDDNVTYSNPPGYNLNGPVIFRLPQSLDEISGIVYNQRDNSVLAINDEHGWLYKVHLKDEMDMERWYYFKGADFEDLVLVDSTFYVLESNGNIIRFKFVTPDSITLREFDFPGEGKNEFEILYHDKGRKQLILLCKDCEADDKNSLSAYAFNLDSATYTNVPVYVMDIRKIEDIMDEKKLRFKPSAATIHPMTGELYIMSSINKVLVIADVNGIPKKVFRIDPKLYKQPEGMAFTPRGDLIVSNEFAEIGAANILFIKYKSTATP
jgi:hypothetical protein